MPHHEHDIFENRKQFQLERLILFSDAVFAIAITLLVIEIKVPDLHEVRDSKHLLEAIGQKFPEFLGFITSFVMIGQFWTQHHRLFGMVNDFDMKLLWLNLHLLLWIVIVPFSSALNSHYGDFDGVWMWYSFNMFMIGMSLYFLWSYIGNPKRKLSELANDPVRRKSARVRSLSIACIFLTGLILCLPGWQPASDAARVIYFLIFPAMIIVNRRYKYKK